MSLITIAGWRHFAWIVWLASVVRGVTLVVHHAQLAADPDAYREIARGLTLCKTFGIVSFDPTTHSAMSSPTAFRPPLYPWLLSWLTQSDGSLSEGAVACLHLFLGVFTVAMTYLVALRLLQTSRLERRGWLASFAAGLVIVDPLLLQSSALVMTETLATALVVLVFWLWLNAVDALEASQESSQSLLPSLILNGVLLGVGFSLAYLCRPTFIVWPVLMSLYLMGWAIRRRQAQPLVVLAAMLLVVSLTVAAWTARNLKQFGRPIWATTHGGYTLLLGNNPPFYSHLRTEGASKVPFWRKNWDPQFFFDRWEQRHQADPRPAEFWELETVPESDDESEKPSADAGGELAEDRLAYESAKAVIQRDPEGFLLACRWRWERLLSPLPLQTGDRASKTLWFVGTFYSVCFVLVGIGLWRMGRGIFAPRWALGVALWVALVAVHTFYWTDMRMRAPTVPVLSILAAASVTTRRFGATKIV